MTRQKENSKKAICQAHLFIVEILQLLKRADSSGTILLLSEGQNLPMHFLSSAQTQEADLKLFQLQQDVVHSRVCVTGQQHTEATGVQNTHLRDKEASKEETQINP